MLHTNLLTSLAFPDPVGHSIYNYFCHTCNIHFRTARDLEQHMLKSPAHAPFTLREDVAEKLGYLKISDEPDVGSFSHAPNEPTVFRALGCLHFSASKLDPCTRSNCACPRFKLTPSQHTAADPVTDLDSFTSLDGAAGSTLHGHKADEDDDPENITLSYEKPLPDITPEGGEERYVRPPDSSDEDEVKWQKELSKKPPSAFEDRVEMRKRFRKGKNKKAERFARREKNVSDSEKYFRPIPQRAERRILDAYAAADEKLFGQKRFEELEDEMEAQREAVANWQEEIGMRATFDDDPNKVASQLAQDIDCFIRDVLSELSEQTEQERRNKVYTNKVFFEDTLEDVAIDHEFNLADQDQEKLRKAVGKKQNKKLRDLNTEDIVDDIAMDHNQQVGEKNEEHHRKIIGRIQNKRLIGTRTDDMVDDLAMGHLQQVGEKEEEHYRKVIGRIQDKKLTSIRADDMVDDLAMDYAQEVGQKEQEHRRKSGGRLQNRELTDKIILDHTDDLAMGYLYEFDKTAQGTHRETFEVKEAKHEREADPPATDCVQGEAQEHQREISGTQPTKKLKLSEEQRHRTWSHKTPLVSETGNITGNDLMGRAGEDNLEQTANHPSNCMHSEPTSQTAINNKKIMPEQATSDITSGSGAEVKNNQDDGDGYSSPAPTPKKDRKQLRKEANAKFEAMMEEMLRAQEG